MFRPIFRKEIVSHVLSLRFGATFILCLLLVFASIFVTSHKHESDVKQIPARVATAQKEMKRIMDSTDDGKRRLDRVVRYMGRIDVLRVPELSWAAQGLWPHMPGAVRTTIEECEPLGDDTSGSPLAKLLPIPDLVYVVGVVLSLLAILFAFDSICGEKESGTLRLMLSNAVPRDSVLLAKWLGGYAVLIVPFLIAAVGGLGYAWWKGLLEMSASNLQRIGVVLAVACLYISVFFTLSLVVSAATHRAATALFFCLLIWVAWILVIPNLAPVAAKIVEPTPSVKKINTEKIEIDKDIDLRKERLTLTSGELQYGQKIERLKEKLDREGERLKERLDRYFERTVERQTALAETLGRVSTLACWTYSAVALTDTGPDAHKIL